MLFKKINQILFVIFIHIFDTSIQQSNILKASWTGPNYYKYLLENGLEENFPPTKTDRQGYPKCLPVSRLTEGLYLNNINRNIQAEIPPWFNRTKAELGKKFIRDNFFSYFYAQGILLALQSANTLTWSRLFAHSGNFKKNEPERGARHITGTFLQIKLWLESDFDSSAWIDSIINVNSIHETIAFKARTKKDWGIRKPILKRPRGYEDSPMWTAFKKDLRAAKISKNYSKNPRLNSLIDGTSKELPFNMFDMTLISWTNLCPLIVFRKKLHIVHSTEEEFMGFAHLWAVISYLLGIDDSYNIALHRDFPSVYNYCKEIFETQAMSGLVHLEVDDSYETQVAFENLIDASVLTFPIFFTKEAWLWNFLNLLNIPAPNLKKILGWQGNAATRLELSFLRPSLRTWVGTRIMNYYMRNSLRIASLKYYGFDGSNQTLVAEKGFFYGDADPIYKEKQIMENNDNDLNFNYY